MNVLKEINELAGKTVILPEEKKKIDDRRMYPANTTDGLFLIEQARKITSVEWVDVYQKRYEQELQNYQQDSNNDVCRAAKREFIANGTPVRDTIQREVLKLVANRKARWDYSASLIRADLTDFCQKIEQDIRKELARKKFVFEIGAKAQRGDEWSPFEQTLKDYEFLEGFPALGSYVIDVRVRILNSIYHYVKPSVKTQQEATQEGQQEEGTE